MAESYIVDLISVVDSLSDVWLIPGLLMLATNEKGEPLEMRYLKISFLQVSSFVGYLLVFLSHRLSQLHKASAVLCGSLHVSPLWSVK